jgi:hypothetical protein
MPVQSIQIIVETQKLICLEDGVPVWETRVSTATAGAGEEPESFRTPRGLHRIVEKIGAGEPIGTVFKGRKPTGEVWPHAMKGDPDAENLILTRILRLAGKEPHNQTSFDRFIYIHGTNREECIGTPASKGCICLRNADMLRLFDWAEEGTGVLIQEHYV